MRLTVARVKPTRAAIAPCLMPSRASANTSCLIPIGVGRGIVRTIRKTFEKLCKCWFKVVTVWRLIWGNDHLYCGFRARRSHLTLHGMSAQGSVGFRWGTITGPYHANFSQVETQKFDPHWFYCLQWGCNNPFCQECITFQPVQKILGLFTVQLPGWAPSTTRKQHTLAPVRYGWHMVCSMYGSCVIPNVPTKILHRQGYRCHEFGSRSCSLAVPHVLEK